MHNVLVILRGISGSGKSTHAKKLVDGFVKGGGNPNNAKIVSADNYFIRSDGRYEFDPSELQEAHNQSVRACIEALRDDNDLVLVDNTNCSVVELSPYYAMGLAARYQVMIVEFPMAAELASRRTLHGVPLAALKRQERVFVDHKALFAPWWRWESAQ